MKANLFGKIVALVVFIFATEISFSQGFFNLKFETATITPAPGSPGYVATVPGWTSIIAGVSQDLNSYSVALNDIALDSAMITLHGTNSPFAPAIQGSYSILLQGGSPYSGGYSGTNGASIAQTGQIPLTAKSIVYWGGALQVTFNGQMLLVNQNSNTSNYTVWSADISAYAGQTGKLLFTVPWQNSAMLDNIQFSSQSIPEPNVLALGALGVLLLGLSSPADF